jgi:beta-phosphoglucomutase-like phosphatase (HAD superfamily)
VTNSAGSRVGRRARCGPQGEAQEAPRKLRALIFDVDGTLADTEEAHRCAFNEAFQQLELQWTWSKSLYAHLLLVAGGKERLAAYIESLDVGPAERQALLDRIEAIHRAKTENYTRKLRAGEVPLRAGVARLIDDAVQSRIGLSIASTTTFANIDALLRATLGPAAIDRFTVVGAGDQVARKKPAPDIYEYVLRQLHASPEECVAIEDSANGLRAAKTAGLYTVVTPSYWTYTEDFSAADMVLPSLDSLLGIRELERQLTRGTH